MTDQSQIDQWRALAEAATPGPWKLHLVDDTTIISNNGLDICTTCDSAEVERHDSYNIEYERMEADAAFIAASREAVPALIAEVERLREALGAAIGNMMNVQIGLGAGDTKAKAEKALSDAISRARAALEGK